MQQYCKLHEIEIVATLGYGLQGIVYKTSRRSAAKVHLHKAGYLRERDAYLRLADHNVHNVRGFSVPLLRGYDDQRLIIEMTLVSPPFIVDFGGAYLDELCLRHLLLILAVLT